MPIHPPTIEIAGQHSITASIRPRPRHLPFGVSAWKASSASRLPPPPLAARQNLAAGHRGAALRAARISGGVLRVSRCRRLTLQFWVRVPRFFRQLHVPHLSSSTQKVKPSFDIGMRMALSSCPREQDPRRSGPETLAIDEIESHLIVTENVTENVT